MNRVPNRALHALDHGAEVLDHLVERRDHHVLAQTLHGLVVVARTARTPPARAGRACTAATTRPRPAARGPGRSSGSRTGRRSARPAGEWSRTASSDALAVGVAERPFGVRVRRAREAVEDELGPGCDHGVAQLRAEADVRVADHAGVDQRIVQPVARGRREHRREQTGLRTLRVLVCVLVSAAAAHRHRHALPVVTRSQARPMRAARSVPILPLPLRHVSRRCRPQYAPSPRIATRTVFHRMSRSKESDQFST